MYNINPMTPPKIFTIIISTIAFIISELKAINLKIKLITYRHNSIFPSTIDNSFLFMLPINIKLLVRGRVNSPLTGRSSSENRACRFPAHGSALNDSHYISSRCIHIIYIISNVWIDQRIFLQE